MHLLSSSLGKLVLSLLLLGALLPIIVRFFGATWKRLDAEAEQARGQKTKGLRPTLRAPATYVLAAISLLLINDYGSREFYSDTIYPWLGRLADAHPQLLHLDYYDELYWRIFWGISRYGGYLLPVLLWPLLFRENPLDLGLRFRGLREHAWIYVLCLVVIIPVLYVVSFVPDFQNYYPMYKLAGRSWVDFVVWEGVYLGQFLTLEVFFRGFLLRGARSLGASAIFAMVVPYAMIHFPKPYLESCGAIVAGIVLGSLSMQTGSIWAGFLVHSTVAVLMDALSLERRGQMPSRLTPTSPPLYPFPYAQAMLWLCWGLAIVLLAYLMYRRAQCQRASRLAPALSKRKSKG